MRSVLVAAAIAALTAPAAGRPAVRKKSDPTKLGSVARVNVGRELRPVRDGTAMVRRADPPLTAEEATAAAIQKLLRGPVLRRGVTGIFVADARTGEPLFAVNADDPLNPASNVKLISTATALELLGPNYRYPTRLLGAAPRDGVVHGDIYLLGSHDPTLAVADFQELGHALAARGITKVEGNLVIGADPTRDGIYRAVVPVQIAAGEPGKPAVAHLPEGFDFIEVTSTATTARVAMRPRLGYKTTYVPVPGGEPRIQLAISGAIGKGGKVEYALWTKERTLTAAYAAVAALRANQIAFTGTVVTRELEAFVGEAVARGALPEELARHESRPVAEIVARINKWSINWLADRLVMTAAGLARQQAPSMELAIEQMYAWIDRHARVPRDRILLDTGSGLSYRTQISPRELVTVLRSAGGFAGAASVDPAAARVWLGSLSVGRVDGTLQHRFRNCDLHGGRVVGKTGTLSTVIALSGVLDVDPQRPLAFSIVTNTDAPLTKALVRRAHDQLVSELVRYVTRTAVVAPPEPPPSPTAPAAPNPELPDEPEASAGERALDQETATGN